MTGAIGSDSRRNSAVISSRPRLSASVRRSRVSHWRIRERARLVATNCSQSCDGPASGSLEVITSTVSPVESFVVSATRRPPTRAPMHP